jgi:hypothetical protein
MRKMTMWVAGALVAAAGLNPMVSYAEEAAAEPAPVSASLDVPVLSAYVWRGQVLNDQAVIQPSLTVSKNGFAINWWGNYNLTDEVTGEANEFSEHDIGVYYTWVCPKTEVSASLGVVNYDFPNQGIPVGDGHDEHVSLINDTREAYVTIAAPVVLAPTLSVYYDFKEADGFYGNFAISHGFELTEQASLNVGASVGYADSDYNAFYFGVDDNDFNDANVSATLPISVTDSLTITPGVSYTMLIDDDIEDAAAVLYKDKDQVVGSLKASYAF